MKRCGWGLSLAHCSGHEMSRTKLAPDVCYRLLWRALHSSLYAQVPPMLRLLGADGAQAGVARNMARWLSADLDIVSPSESADGLTSGDHHGQHPPSSSQRHPIPRWEAAILRARSCDSFRRHNYAQTSLTRKRRRRAANAFDARPLRIVST